MTGQEKKKAFNAAVKAGLKQRTAIQINTRDEIVRLLKQAQEQISITLANQPSDYQRWSLPDLQFEINRMLKEFGEAGAVVIGSAAGESWQAGKDLMDKPLEAASMAQVIAAMPHLDAQQLNAMRAFMTDRIKDIGVQGANKINSELGLVVIGAQSPGDAISRVKNILGDPSRKRAATIVRTELGRVFSVASNVRMQQAAAAGANIQKKWLRSGKLHPRPGHNLMHGKTIPVHERFSVPRSKGGMPVLMLHPHDPSAPASETINCGCTCVPAASGFEGAEYVSKVQKPGGDQWTKEELRQQASNFAEKKGLSPGKGVPAKSTMQQYAGNAFSDKVKGRLEIGGTEKWFAIKQDTGVDVGGYKTVLDSEKLRHIHKKHGGGNERNKNQRAVTANDITHIPDILTSYDKVTLSKTDRGLEALMFEKAIQGEVFTYVAEVRNGKKQLAATTMYIRKKPRGGAVPD